MRIMGIDPGTATTGFSILENKNGQLKLLEYGCIKTSSKLDPSIRLQQISEDLRFIIKKWQPNLASIEKLFFNKNVKTAMQVAQARGVILQNLTDLKIPQKHFTPLQIKHAVCGDGKADKKMIMKMVKIILKLNFEITSDDAADAIAAAICLANHSPLLSQ